MKKYMVFRDLPSDILLVVGLSLILIVLTCGTFITSNLHTNSNIHQYRYTASVNIFKTDEEYDKKLRLEDIDNLTNKYKFDDIRLELVANVGEGLDQTIVDIDLSRHNKMQNLHYYGVSNAAENSACFIGENLKNMVDKDNGSIFVISNDIKVDGIIKSDISDENSWKAILLWDNLRKEDKAVLSDGIDQLLAKSELTSFYFADNDDIKNKVNSLVEDLKSASGLIVNIGDADDGGETFAEDTIIDNFIHVFYILSIIYAIICYITVIKFWSARRHKEWMICYALGFSYGRLYKRVVYENIRCIFLAVIAAFIFDLFYMRINAIRFDLFFDPVSIVKEFVLFIIIWQSVLLFNMRGDIYYDRAK